MCDIKVEPKDVEICRGCLSPSRRLSPVDAADYLPLLTEDQTLELDVNKPAVLCWECAALLRRTVLFLARVQRAHRILHDYSQLVPIITTLSSLSVHHNFEYDAVFEENTPPELPLLYKEPSSLVHHDKVVVPTKYKTEDTKTDVNIIKTVKVVLEDVLQKNIKSECPSDDSDDDYSVDDDDSCSSSGEVIDTRNDSRETIRIVAINKLPVVKQQNLQEEPEITRDIIKTPALLKLEQELQQFIRSNKVAPKRRRANPAQRKSVKIVKHNSNKGRNKSKIKVEIDLDNPADKADLNLSAQTNFKLNETPFYKKAQKKKEKTQSKVFSKYREVRTRFRNIEEVLPYFREIEMNEQDLKRTLEKDDAIVDKLRPHKCNLCGYQYALAKHLRGHALAKHKSTHPELFERSVFRNPAPALPPVLRACAAWRCAVCARALRRAHLVAHMNEAHPRKYLCNACDWSVKPFWTKADRQRHWKTVHKQFICDICNKRKRTKAAMELHMEFQCAHCGKSFTRKSSLIKHINLAHNGKSDYQCHICGKYLNKRWTLRNHLNIHNNVKVRVPKNHRCHVCGHMFVSSSSLQYHMNMHTGARPYGCTECEAAFTQPYTLRLHLAKQHQIQASSVRNDGTIILATKPLI
ncbi:zinc finger protein 37 homolog isoform X2 [Leguminivora glycinivorella]|uniref:zinc finger protein 37 homolog isoform X2 n=1 Tax=Leguminivora glycinivorella TaxID=1035111 RepID=UPI0020102107|nr:zinc finger protein 37 homolog isoform X2 [Leguminivora glycinivorella]